MRTSGAVLAFLLALLGCGSRSSLSLLVGHASDDDEGDGRGPSTGGRAHGTGGTPAGIGGNAGGTTGTGGSTGGTSDGGIGGDRGGAGGSSDGGVEGDGGSTGSGGGPPEDAVLRVYAGDLHSCALLTGGRVRCWGDARFGTLGYGNVETIGDDEAPYTAGDVPLGKAAVDLAVGRAQTCALLEDGAVRCWGSQAAIGYPGLATVGDDETPDSVGDVELGGSAYAIAAGTDHTCALLQYGRVRCWGYGAGGRLGYANEETVGDDETPASVGEVDVGGTAIGLTCGAGHTCALLSTGAVRCWGYGFEGQLGHANRETVGDNETPASAGSIELGGNAVQIAAGYWHTCAVLDTGAVRCWGYGVGGPLGYGNQTNIGDDETPASAGDVPVGGTVASITAGWAFTCAILTTGGVRCWGQNGAGYLGYGNKSAIGDDETPSSVGNVPLGGDVVQMDSSYHSCSLLASGAVKCWGDNYFSALGLGTTDLQLVGDDETPDAAPNVQVLDP